MLPELSGTLSSTRVSRRNVTRRAVTLPCQAVRECDFKLVADRTLDVSTEGLLLPLRTRVLTGETLILSFSLPTGFWIDAEGVVARVVHGRRPGDDGLAIGVMFNTISPSARAALAAFLHGRQEPLPRRGPLTRLRRGEVVPQLADAALMTSSFFASSSDVEEIEDEPPHVDGLGVLRAVVDAWQSLVVDNDVALAR